MAQRFFTPEQIQQGVPGLPDPRWLFYTVRGPVPSFILVWQHPSTEKMLVRLATMNPVSWRPYAMTTSFLLTDVHVVDTLREGDTCVMAWATPALVRASYLAALNLPANVDQLQVCRLRAVPSPYGPVPHLADCPMNLECRVARVVDYRAVRVYFLNVEYGSLDEEILPLPREEVLKRYHLYEVDRVPNEWGGERLRLGLAGNLYACPTFPVTAKSGWSNSFPAWMADLRDEGYLSQEEWAKVTGWHNCWLAIFENLEHAQRKRLRQHLTTVCQTIAWQEWDRLHDYLALQEAVGS